MTQLDLPLHGEKPLPIITFFDGKPDQEGRRTYSKDWVDCGGTFQPQPHPADGRPVGWRRGQFFFGIPEEGR